MNPSESASHVETRERLALLAVLTLVAGWAVWRGLMRPFLLPNTETDFVGGFQPEALRLATGQRLEMGYHPPGYPAALAVAHALLDDWFRSALLLSGLAACVAVAVSYMAFRRLAGLWAAWGAIAGCLLSSSFLEYATLASSDVTYAALFLAALAAAIRGMTGGGSGTWAVTGVLMAAAILTRSNGLAAAVILLMPLLGNSQRAMAVRIRDLGTLLLGAAAPMLAWLLYASATGSPLAPTHNYVNVAMSLFSSGPGTTGDELQEMSSRFDNLWQVLTYDPATAIRVYAWRAIELPRRLVFEVTSPVIALAALPGLLGLYLHACNRRAYLLVLASLAASVALTSIKPFESRYYLVLCPLLGAAAAMVARTIVVALTDWRPSAARIATTVLVTGVALGLPPAMRHAVASQENPLEAELAESVPAVTQVTEPHASIISRKGMVVYHASRRFAQLPVADTVSQLEQALCERYGSRRPLYLFVGTAERTLRPALFTDLAHSMPVEWLEPVATGVRVPWTLYKVVLSCGSHDQTSVPTHTSSAAQHTHRRLRRRHVLR